MSFAKQNLIILESVDSTNNYAMALAQNGQANNGDAAFAVHQTMGKGTRGKEWQSNKGENIIISILAEMQWQPAYQQFPLSVAVALGCFELVLKYVKEKVTIKWPNDIFIGDSKAGGILIENILKGNLWQWAVIGIGININQDEFKNEIIEATSLKQVTGKQHDVITLAKELHEIVLKKIQMLRSGKYKEMLKEYNENLFCKKEKVRLKKENVVFETTIVEVTSGGELITYDAIERKFHFGEIVWIKG